jgi:hypothetical protein
MSGIPGQEMTGLEMMGPSEHGAEVMAALLARRPSDPMAPAPDQTAAPYRWLPAQADRHSRTT